MTTKETMEQFDEEGFIYAPNSIYHGSKIYSHEIGDQLINCNIEKHRLIDFLEFLFDHSEHCDHITQPDAWAEFVEYEAKDSWVETRLKK